MSLRKAKGIVGHVDTIDETGITGWVAGGVTGSPNLRLRVGGQYREAVIERRERPDVAAVHGPGALNAGFFIKLDGIVPRDKGRLPDFLAKIQVRADGQLIKPSADAIPLSLRRRGIFARIRRLGRPKSQHEQPSKISAAEQEKYFAAPARDARLHGQSMELVSSNVQRTKSSDIFVFVTARNEMLRIPYFLDYYRRMGVNHFFFVDNDSTDGLSEYLKTFDDCSVWHSTASYKASNFGMHWLNHLLHQYGAGHWCLTLDPDEFLVFPKWESRNLRELVEFLDRESQDHLFCILLDMYSDKRVSETFCDAGQDPLEVAPFFDGTGYVQRDDASYGETFVQGGARRRVFFRQAPENAPAVNKTPLVKWQAHYNYLSSTHLLAPREVNWPHGANRLCVTGCLLHFKFLSTMAAKAAEEIERKQHFQNSIEYQRYHNVIIDEKDVLYYEKSLRLEGSKQLCDLGFMSQGAWF